MSSHETRPRGMTGDDIGRGHRLALQNRAAARRLAMYTAYRAIDASPGSWHAGGPPFAFHTKQMFTHPAGLRPPPVFWMCDPVWLEDSHTLFSSKRIIS